jgi:hypothetical protein
MAKRIEVGQILSAAPSAPCLPQHTYAVKHLVLLDHVIHSLPDQFALGFPGAPRERAQGLLLCFGQVNLRADHGIPL